MDAPGTKHRDVLAAAVVFILLAIALTYPFALHLDSHLRDDGDSYEYAWVLGFGAYQLTHQPLHLYDGNILYPFPLSLAYSDSSIPNVVLGAPIVLLTGNPVLALNVLTLLTFALAGFGMYLLVHDRTGSRLAAFGAGLAYGFSPYLFDHVPQIPNISIEWAPFALWSFDRYLTNGRTRWAAGFALATMLQVLVSFYYAFILGIGIAIYVVARLAQNRAVLRRPGWILRLLGCVGAASLLAAPLVYPYFEVAHQFALQRTLGEAATYSAWPANYLATTSSQRIQFIAPLVSLLQARDPTLQIAAPERQLYPGLVATVLAIVGLARARPARWIAPALMGVLGVVLSFGPIFHLRNDVAIALPFPMPYAVLFDVVPGFTALRVPARFGALAVLGIALLAGDGLSAIRGQINAVGSPRRWQPRVSTLVGCVCLALLAAEGADRMAGVPVLTGAAVPPVYRWLATQPIPSPVVEIPIDVDAFRESPRSYYSTYDHQPLVNGSRSFLPPGYEAMTGILATFPSRSATSLLARLGIRLVVVHRDQLPSLAVSLLPDTNGDVKRVARFGSDDVYEVTGQPQPQPINLVATPPCVPGPGEPGTVAVTLESADGQPISVVAPSTKDLGFQLNWQGLDGRSEQEVVRAAVSGPVLSLPQEIAVDYQAPARRDVNALTVSLIEQDGLRATPATVSVTRRVTPGAANESTPTLVSAKLTSSRGIAGDGVPFELHWRYDAVPADHLVAFVNAYDDQARYWSEPLAEPEQFQTPPGCPGGEVVESQRLRFDPGTPVGTYRVEVGIMNESTGDRIAFLGPSRSEMTKLDLGLFRVLPASVIPNGARINPGDEPRVFANAIALDFARIAGPMTPGSPLPVDLRWSSVHPVGVDYTMFIHVTDRTGAVVAQTDHPIGGGEFPSSAWQSDDALLDPETVTIPPNVPSGPLDVWVGLYDLRTMKRLPVTSGGAGAGADDVKIGTIGP